MKEQNDPNGPKRLPLREAISWWERRRLHYSAIIVVWAAWTLWDFWDYPMRVEIGDGGPIMEVFVLLIGANFCYTFSWVAETMATKVFGEPSSSNGWRWFFYILGTLFSLILISFYFGLEFDVMHAY